MWKYVKRYLPLAVLAGLFTVGSRKPPLLPAIMSMARLCTLGAYTPHRVPKTTAASIPSTIAFSLPKYAAIRLSAAPAFSACSTVANRAPGPRFIMPGMLRISTLGFCSGNMFSPLSQL